MARTKPIHTTSHYKRVHKWLIRNYKKSRKCAFCHKTSGKFEWALLKGCSYEKKIENFIELCISCHRQYDGIIEKLALRKLKPVTATNSEETLKFSSIKEACKTLDVLPSSVSNNLKGRSNSAGGYEWRYV